jgi:alkanesulfonate monooxygenase SsuD/methylene tetrahydromethanopterin reductase-like flavin-dependent oxidoreductase (luciferase family)
MARTLDHISAHDTGTGRFIFGTGAGWFEKDYTEYGYDFGTAGSRIDALGEALPRIEARWAQLNPAPTRRIPILIGGSGEKKTLRLVARHADIWHSFPDPETLTRKLGILAEHCVAEGRDLAEIEISVENRHGDEAKADALRELGATLFTVGVSGPDYPLDAVKRMVAWRDANS